MSRDFNQDGEFFDVAQDPEVLEGLAEALHEMGLRHQAIDLRTKMNPVSLPDRQRACWGGRIADPDS